MVPLKNVLLALGFAGVFTGLLVFSFGTGTTQEDVMPPRRVMPTSVETAEPGTAGRREVSLLEAIRIAEKLGRGKAIKAERRDRPEVEFKIELMGWDGSKKKIDLTADGKLKEMGSGAEEKKSDERKKRPTEKRRAAATILSPVYASCHQSKSFAVARRGGEAALELAS